MDDMRVQMKDFGVQFSEILKVNNVKYLKGNLETLKNVIEVYMF